MKLRILTALALGASLSSCTDSDFEYESPFTVTLPKQEEPPQ
jgi:hypothetical protein